MAESDQNAFLRNIQTQSIFNFKKQLDIRVNNRDRNYGSVPENNNLNPQNDNTNINRKSVWSPFSICFGAMSLIIIITMLALFLWKR